MYGGLSKTSLKYLIPIQRIDREAHGMFVVGLSNSYGGRRAHQRWATGVEAARRGKQTKMMQEDQYTKMNKLCYLDLTGVKAQAMQQSKDHRNSVSNVEH